MIWNRLERHADLGLLIARLMFGLGFFWFHGLPKLSGGPEMWAGVGGAMTNVAKIGVAPVFWGLLASLGESLGGLLIAAGLFFRPATLLLAAVMVVATGNHILTGQGTPAHAFKNAGVAAGLFLIGPGRYSLDHWLARRRSR